MTWTARSVGRAQAAGVAQRAQHGEVEPVDEHEHGVPAVVRRLGLVLARIQVDEVERARLGAVLPVQPHQHQPQRPGTARTTSQAPSLNLTTAKISTTQRRHDAAGQVDRAACAASPARDACGGTCAMPSPAMREAGEHADRVERDQRCRRSRRRRSSSASASDGQHDDAVAEREPVPAPGQLPRQERVLGDEAGQEREAGERRVRAGDTGSARSRPARATKPMCPNHAVPNAALATWLITVGVPLAYGVACVSPGEEGDAEHEACRAARS